tara:strand:+ start:1178 stop:1990 length:813 start_codon:yes stop_codon:yes gene_type:complete
MNTFDSVWSLLKASITHTEYISGYPYAEGGFGPMDITFNVDTQGASGGAMLRPPTFFGQPPFDRPTGYAILNPSIYYKKKFPNGGDSLTEEQEKDLMYHTGAVALHEATHQGVHWAEPRLQALYGQQPQAHEYAAYTAEHEADTKHPNFMPKLNALWNHPMVNEEGPHVRQPETPRMQKIQALAMDLKGIKDPYDQAQIVGNRARMNAKAEMERLEEKNKLMAEIDRLEESVDWDNATNEEINAVFTHTRGLGDRVRELGRWYDDILQGI